MSEPAEVAAILAAAGGVLGGVWRMTRGVLKHIETTRLAQTAESNMHADRLERAEERCVEQMAGLTRELKPVLERCCVALERAESPSRFGVLHVDEHTTLDNPNNEPVYGIPPGERVPEITLRDASLLEEKRDWGHDVLGLPELHARGVTGAGVVVAILDTGVDEQHPGLSGQVIGGADFTRSPSGRADRQGHGTHCAGVVAEKMDGSGLRGVAPAAKLMNFKVLGDSGSGLSSGIAAGIRAATAAKVDVISMSLGGPTPDADTRSAINEAVAAGVWVVAAAGNDGPGVSNSFPGNYPNVVCVAAIDQNLAVARFSSRNIQVDIAAPGVSIMSTYPGGRYASLSGTSMATPCIAAVLALGRSECKKLGIPVPSLEVAMKAMKATAKDIQPSGNDTATGAGLIQPAAFIAALTKDRPTPIDPPPVDQPHKVIKFTSPDLTVLGVEAITVVVKPSQQPTPPPALQDGLFELPVALRLAVKALLPILRRLAERSQTPIDDLLIKIFEQVFGLASNRQLTENPPGYPAWLDVAMKLLKSLLPFIKELAAKTDTPIDDMIVEIVETILSRMSRSVGVTSTELRNTADQFIERYQLRIG